MKNPIRAFFDYVTGGSGAQTATHSGVTAPDIGIDIDPLLTRFDFTVKSNVLEETGIFPVFSSEKITAEFDMYSPDATGEEDWLEYQETWLGSYIYYGETFEERIGSQFRLWPASALADNGIQRDSDNQPTKYTFNVWVNGSIVRQHIVEAANMIHIYNKKRAGVVRGKSYFQAAKKQLEALYNTNFYQGKMLETSALNPVILKLGKEGLNQLAQEWARDERPSDDELAERFAQKIQTKPGSTTVTTNTVDPIAIDRSKGYPADATDSWAEQTFILIAAGLGLSKATITGDYRHLLAVAVRAIRDHDTKYYKRLQRKVLKASKNWYMAWVESQNPNKQSTILNAFTSWSKPGFPALEPEKDAKAVASDLEQMLESRTHILRTRGRDPEEHAKELENDRRLGLVPSGSSSNSSSSSSSDSADDEEEEQGDEESRSRS